MMFIAPEKTLKGQGYLLILKTNTSPPDTEAKSVGKPRVSLIRAGGT